MKRMQNIIEEEFVLGPFLSAKRNDLFGKRNGPDGKRNDLFAKRNGPNAKKEKNNANNESQKQKENEKHTLHNIFNFIIAVIQNLLHRIYPRKRTPSACI